MSIYESLPWHAGELAMHGLVGGPGSENPTTPYLTSERAAFLRQCPLLAVGALDEAGWPWTTVWGGEPDFTRQIAASVVGVRTLVARKGDPVVETLFRHVGAGEVVQHGGGGGDGGRMVSALGIDLARRKRVKLAGRMVAGAVERVRGNEGKGDGSVDEEVGLMQLAIKVEQSLGNCPKYLNKKDIIPSVPQPELLSVSLPFAEPAVQLLSRADIFFMSTSNHSMDMDTNHRGGTPGFVRVLANNDEECTLVWPEYSGNRLYQSLGNLMETPRAGLIIPDFDTGDALYLTGTTDVLVGKDASALLPRSNLLVKLTVEKARHVARCLSFRAQPGEPSPYNPGIWFLGKEQRQAPIVKKHEIRVSMVDKKILTPTVARFHFRAQDVVGGLSWRPGQWVALAFDKELSTGYSHMRPDDPRSLNDDYIRTFTVSSPAPAPTSPLDAGAKCDAFEITARRLGPVTEFLFKHNVRAELDVVLTGFGGEFAIEQTPNERVAFVAAGVGITPLLGQASVLDLDRLTLFWTVRAEDLGLVVDTFEQVPELATRTRLFVTGLLAGDEARATTLHDLTNAGCRSETRRLTKADLLDVPARAGYDVVDAGDEEAGATKWYLCTGMVLRKVVLEWLSDQEVVYEDFDY